MSLQTKVEDLIGSITDTAALTQHLTAGAKFITNLLPPKELERYSADLTDAGSGVTSIGHRVFGAHKSGYPADRIMSNEKGRAGDSDSIEAATATDPSWYEEKNKGYVLPGGGTLQGMAYPTPAFDDDVIAGFPADKEHGVVLYAAIQTQHLTITNLLRTTLNGLSWNAPTAPTAPSAPSFTYTDAVPEDALYTDASYTAASHINALVDTISSTTISALDTAPSYVKPSFEGDFSTITTPLDTNSDIELAGSHLSRVGQYLEQYGKDLYNELNKFNAETVEYQAELQKKIEQARLDQQRLTEQARLQVQVNQDNARREVETALQNARNTSDIDAVNRAKQAEIDITNKAKELEADIINESKELERQISEYQSKLQLYQTDTAVYQSDTNAEVSRLRTLIDKNTSEVTGLIGLLQSLKDEFKIFLGSING